MAAFQPLGETARWRLILELLRDADVDAVITYEQMAETLDLDADADRHAIQMAVRRAAREHEEEDKRALEAVPNVGYRIVQPPEHLRLARQQQKRSSRALAVGRGKVVNVDLNALEPEVRSAFQVVAQAFAMQMDFNRRMDVRQKRLQDAVEAVAERTNRSEAEIAELKARLERLEAHRPESTPDE